MKNSDNKGIKFFLAIYNSALMFASATLGYILLYTFYMQSDKSTKGTTKLKQDSTKNYLQPHIRNPRKNDAYSSEELAKFYTDYRYVLMAYEAVQFAELIFHTAGISNLRYNALINILVSNFMIFVIVDKFNTSYTFYWISARVVSRGVKHMYNFYINTLGRYQIIGMDYFRFNSFYILYPAELITMGVAVCYSKTQMDSSPYIFEYEGFYISWFHIGVLFMIGAAANFASTSHYLHNKRQELIELYIEKYAL